MPVQKSNPAPMSTHVPNTRSDQPIPSAKYHAAVRTARKTFDDLTKSQTVEEFLETAKWRIDWLEQVSEIEYDVVDRNRIREACREFFSKVQPIVSKYIDGE